MEQQFARSVGKLFYWVEFSDMCCRFRFVGYLGRLSAASGVLRHNDSRERFEFVILLKLVDKGSNLG